jgi:hypothetical protein
MHDALIFFLGLSTGSLTCAIVLACLFVGRKADEPAASRRPDLFLIEGTHP